jgi:hypothetical protein
MAASPLNRVAGVLPMWMACRGATLFALANASDFNVADFALECFFMPACRLNPAFIPRNHRVEAALEAASTHGDFAPFRKLLNILEHPYDDQPGCSEFEQPLAPGERVHRTYRGT